MLYIGISYINIPKTQNHEKAASKTQDVFAQLSPSLSVNPKVFVHSEIQDNQDNLFFDTEGKEKSYKKQKAFKPSFSNYNPSNGYIFHPFSVSFVAKKTLDFIHQPQFCIPTQDLFIKYNALII